MFNCDSPAKALFTPAYRVLKSLCLFSFLVFVAAAAIQGQTFTGANTGPIPDAPVSQTCGAPLDVTFAVSGYSRPIGSGSVSFTVDPTHTFAGDVVVALIAPNGATHSVFSRLGRNSADAGDEGDGSHLSGTYVFNDTVASPTIWTAASTTADGVVIPAGTYPTQSNAFAAADSPGPPVTSFNAFLASIPAANVNGTWTLRFTDCFDFLTGGISAASLTFLTTTAGDVSLSGRVTTANGAGIRGVVVTISGGNLESPISTTSSSFGRYTFNQLDAGQSYVVSVSGRRYTFVNPTLIVNLEDNAQNVDFVARP